MANENQQAEGSTEKSVVNDLLEDLVKEDQAANGQSDSDGKNTVQDSDQGAQTNNTDSQEGDADSQSTEGDAQDQTAQTSTPTITKDLIEDFGLPKEMLGKPIRELGYSYKNLLQEFTRISQAKAADKSISPQQEPQTFDIDAEVPDAVTQPMEYAAYMKGLAGYVKELRTNTANVPLIQQSFEKQEAKAVIQTTIGIIQKKLPDGEDAQKVLFNWYKDNQALIPALEQAGVFKGEPDKFASHVLQYYKANQYDVISTQQNKASVKNKHEDAVARQRNLSKASSNASQGTFPRANAEKASIVSDILNDLTAEEQFK